MDPVTQIDVARSPDGSFTLAWGAALGDEPVKVRVAMDVDSLAAAPVAGEGRARVEVAALAPGARHYFLLEPAASAALVVAERAVALMGGVNFRDLGGYRTVDGRRVRWGRLFRSGHTANFTAADQDTFAALGIRTVCDFRLAEERANESTELPGPPALHVLGIEPGLGDKFFFHRLFASTDDPQALMDAMRAMLVSLVRNVAPRYGRLFEVLRANPPGAVLMNCSAGKERTGVGAALVLSALGVPRETILYDFMLSRIHFPAEAEIPRVLEKYAVKQRGAAGRALIMPLLETHASFLEAAFAAIDEDFGSTAAFLAHHYGLGPVECARLQDIYTVRGEESIA
jgi:protein-tyrosine phosphatase